MSTIARILLWAVAFVATTGCAEAETLRILAESQDLPECRAPENLALAYQRGVTWRSNPQGLVSTGLLGVPFDRATLKKDLVVANGNDVAPQPITTYYARKDALSTAFPQFVRLPEWVSDRHAKHGQVAAGDIDHDGLLDLVSAVIIDYPVEISRADGTRHPTGGLVVYKGVETCADGRTAADSCSKRATLASLPEASISGFSTLSVSLGDVNGDGWLDLATGALIESSSPVVLPGERPKGPWKIYLNEHGTFDWARPITSTQSFNATDVELADVDLDGRLDLVLSAGRRIHVFYGKDDAEGLRTISREAGWSSDASVGTNGDPLLAQFITALDVTLLNPGVDPGGAIAVSLSCLQNEKPCEGRYLVYRPDLGDQPVWQYSFPGWGGELKFRDMNGDCMTDLAAGSWWTWDVTTESPVPAQLRVFVGDGTTLASAPVWTSQIAGGFVGQAIELADLSCDAVTIASTRFVSPGSSAVLTIPDSNVESIYRIRVGDGMNERELDPSEFSFAVGENWVVVPSSSAGTSITIDYIRSLKPDIVTGTFDFNRGVQLFERAGAAPQATCIPEETQ